MHGRETKLIQSLIITSEENNTLGRPRYRWKGTINRILNMV
jgi:hypothetical protein